MASVRSAGSHTRMPWSQLSTYGSSTAAVPFSITPSTKNFTVRAVSTSAPLASIRLRRSGKSAS